MLDTEAAPPPPLGWPEATPVRVPAGLAHRVPALLPRLEHAEGLVRWATLRALSQVPAASLTPHAPALLARLEDTDRNVRCAALEVVRLLDPAVVPKQAAALLTRVAAEAERDAATAPDEPCLV